VNVAFWSTTIFLGVSGLVSAQIAPTNSATISGNVEDSSGKPVADAKVSLSGPRNAAAQTDSHGQFVFVGIPFGAYRISSAATGLGTAMRSISVEGDITVAIQYEPVSQNGLKVIAQVSSSANASFNVTPASVTQVSPIANAFEGQTSWRTILEQIPGIAQAGLGHGDTTFAALPDGPCVPVQISINGALPYETAILLDDMPLIGSSLGAQTGTGTDLSVYPLNGFGAADVVRGPGANAPSIVDSIGGSFVLHAPGMVNHSHYDFSISTDPYGGIVANGLAAMRWNRLSAVVTYGINNSPGPSNNVGIPSEAGSLTSIPSTINSQSFSPYYPPCPSCAFGSYLLNPNYASASFPLYGVQVGLLTGGISQGTPWNQLSGSAAFTYMLSSSISAEIFYAGQTSRTVSAYQNYTVNFVPPTSYTGAVSPGQHFFETTGGYLAPVFTQQTSSLLEEKITAQLGHGMLQIAALQNRVFVNSSVSTPATATVRLFGGGYFNGSTALTTFNGGTYTATYLPCEFIESQWSDNRDLSLNYTTPLGENFRGGVSFVQSYYNIPRIGDDNFGGFPYTYSTPPDVSQTTNELRIFVGDNPSQKTSLDLSMYFANADYHVQNPSNTATYTDARYSYSAPRLGFVWRPTASVAVRAALGGGFAEAPLSDLVGSNGVPINSGTGYYTMTLTNLNLQPEKSFAFDFGSDVRLHRDTMLSLDIYRSNLYGQVYKSTSATGTYLGLPLYTTQYGNLGKSRFEGVLLDVHHDVSQGFFWSFSGGLTRGYVVNLPTGFHNTAGGTCNTSTGANCTNLTVLTNINFNGQFAASIPYSQVLGTIGYRWNPDKYLDLVGTYYGNNNTYFRPAFTEFDGQIGYPISKRVSLLVTFRNITGIYDGSIQTFSPMIMSGAPTISGLPYPLYGEEYGPRTVILTTSLHL